MEEMSQNKMKLGRCLSSAALFIKLCESDYLNTEHYKNLEFDQPVLKPFIDEFGLNNPSIYQMILYTLLIVPKDILPAKYYYKMDQEYYYLNMTINRIVIEQHSNFNYDKSVPKHIFHIINSILKGRCQYITENKREYMIFEDYTPKCYYFSKLKNKDVLNVIKKIQVIMMLIYNKLD